MIHTANIVINADIMRSKEFFVRMAFNLPVYALFLYDLILSFLKHNQGNISYSSHLAGIFVGLFLGIAGLRNFHEKSWEKNLRRVCGGIIVVSFLVLLGIQFVDFEVELRVTAGGQFSALDEFANEAGLIIRRSEYQTENYVPEPEPVVPTRNRTDNELFGAVEEVTLAELEESDIQRRAVLIWGHVKKKAWCQK